MAGFHCPAGQDLVPDRIFRPFIGIQGHGIAAGSGCKQGIDPGLFPPDLIDGPGHQQKPHLVHTGQDLEPVFRNPVAHKFQVPGFHMGLGQGRIVILAQGKIMEGAVLAQPDQPFVGLEIHQPPGPPVLHDGIGNLGQQGLPFLDLRIAQGSVLVLLVLELGITKDLGAVFLVVPRFHFPDALLGRPHNGAEGIDLQPRVVLFQLFQPLDLFLQVFFQMVVFPGSHQAPIVQAVRSQYRCLCMRGFLFQPVPQGFIVPGTPMVGQVLFRRGGQGIAGRLGGVHGIFQTHRPVVQGNVQNLG